MSFSIPTLRSSFGGSNKGNQGGFDYYVFCASSDDIPGLSVVSSNYGVLYNNFTDLSYTLTSDSITFTIQTGLSLLLTNNPHARLRYSYTRVCSDAPLNAYSLIDQTLTDGLVLNLVQNAGCTGNSNGTEYYVEVTLDTDDGSYLFNDICCSPYSLRCNTLSLPFNFQIFLSA